jgi:hypothetical protein
VVMVKGEIFFDKTRKNGCVQYTTDITQKGGDCSARDGNYGG